MAEEDCDVDDISEMEEEAVFTDSALESEEGEPTPARPPTSFLFADTAMCTVLFSTYFKNHCRPLVTSIVRKSMQTNVYKRLSKDLESHGKL